MKNKIRIFSVILFLITTYVILIFVNSSEEARSYVEDHDYYVVWSNGDNHRYTLDRVTLFNEPYNYIWSLQKDEIREYIDKEITVEAFIGYSFEHGLKSLYVMKSQHKLIGGYSTELTVMPQNGIANTMDGRSFAEVHSGTIEDWEEATRTRLD
ncbi:hypothetical protein ACSVDE_11720 [Pseudalkalibacillus sp. Hm43]|uniref:hypothetical protein n=1 Tax=Pseudalkalibacillus sp. Hm43 TaxID=3450742 RepID=UPI003F434011